MPVITKPNQHFDATLWTGDNTNPRSITNGAAGQSFQPDLVWVKARNSGQFHVLNDSVRGAGTALGLSSQAGNAEGNADIGLYGATTAFNSNGFSVGGGTSNQAFVNLSTVTYVAWQWKAGGAAVTNTAGSISAQVSANPTAGFSVVTYTGNGTSGATVGHGLGVAPSMIIVKARDGAGYEWNVYHSAIGATNWLELNATTASQAGSNRWNNTAPTSSVFSLGNANVVNQNTKTYVAYCFAQVAGYSAFGSYTGNGSDDGPFIYTGFRPRFIFRKCLSNAGENSMQYDTSMNPYNASPEFLSPNLADASNTAGGYYIDFLSNGVKIRHSATGNNSGRTYIYMAFAENPFKFANAR
jgi:hypothetical protein